VNPGHPENSFDLETHPEAFNEMIGLEYDNLEGSEAMPGIRQTQVSYLWMLLAQSLTFASSHS